jgi:hypothetical protein
MSAKCLVLIQESTASPQLALVFDSDQFRKAICLLIASAEGVRGTMKVPYVAGY